jgi:hypothetical protein
MLPNMWESMISGTSNEVSDTIKKGSKEESWGPAAEGMQYVKAKMAHNLFEGMCQTTRNVSERS